MRYSAVFMKKTKQFCGKLHTKLETSDVFNLLWLVFSRDITLFPQIGKKIVLFR